MEDIIEIAMSIISYSGFSRSSSIEAVKKAKVFEFEKAYELLKIADENFVNAHLLQTKLITEEMKGDNLVDLNLLLVHAQDHLTMATIQKENAKEIINVYETIFEIKNK